MPYPVDNRKGQYSGNMDPRPRPIAPPREMLTNPRHHDGRPEPIHTTTAQTKCLAASHTNQRIRQIKMPIAKIRRHILIDNRRNTIATIASVRGNTRKGTTIVRRVQQTANRRTGQRSKRAGGNSQRVSRNGTSVFRQTHRYLTDFPLTARRSAVPSSSGDMSNRQRVGHTSRAMARLSKLLGAKRENIALMRRSTTKGNAQYYFFWVANTMLTNIDTAIVKTGPRSRECKVWPRPIGAVDIRVYMALLQREERSQWHSPRFLM